MPVGYCCGNRAAIGLPLNLVRLFLLAFDPLPLCCLPSPVNSTWSVYTRSRYPLPCSCLPDPTLICLLQFSSLISIYHFLPFPLISLRYVHRLSSLDLVPTVCPYLRTHPGLSISFLPLVPSLLLAMPFSLISPWSIYQGGQYL